MTPHNTATQPSKHAHDACGRPGQCPSAHTPGKSVSWLTDNSESDGKSRLREAECDKYRQLWTPAVGKPIIFTTKQFSVSHQNKGETCIKTPNSGHVYYLIFGSRISLGV